MFLHLTTLLDLDQNPIGTVDAQFVGGAFTSTFMIVATEPDRTGSQVALHPYGPFTTPDDARAWAAAHLAPYMTYTIAPLTAPHTNAEGNAERRTPIRHSTTARPARANTIARYFKPFDLTRLRHTTPTDTPRHGYTARETEHPELGPVVELTALGPDDYQRDRDHSLMQTVLRHNHPRYEVTDQGTHLLVRRLCDAELHARADQAAARVAPHITALTNSTPPPAPGETAADAAHTLFDAILRDAREVASDDPDDSDLIYEIQDMAPHDALAALKKAFLPSDMIEPIAEVLTLLAPHTYTPQAG
ncbi:hypothetical protein OG413_45500 [Streptomyces sp. NBC_01433]|uniref:hypothetical protein n=1 Tax=Streptomyces sp. NBC_01433 TaxID=2903864 RepID=UPI002254111E|nr:hypothetical protein [Streptomyces sp. NBC_01433]MCX4681366.1 hypothetical protein [Streptomyces sp. NBC_01433]MCX4681696.1 hypothetical protein [Streptomyces sp. NBC_01433]MCX4682442.1 hypothetical protein [Streptomyces sp. NBC_01433]